MEKHEIERWESPYCRGARRGGQSVWIHLDPSFISEGAFWRSHRANRTVRPLPGRGLRKARKRGTKFFIRSQQHKGRKEEEYPCLGSCGYSSGKRDFTKSVRRGMMYSLQVCSRLPDSRRRSRCETTYRIITASGRR